MSERTWKIRDQIGTDKRGCVIWGPEREVTLAQYRAELDAAREHALAIHRANIAQVERENPR